MIRTRQLSVAAVFLVTVAACEGVPEDDDASIDETAGTTDPELVSQAAAAPREAPWGSLGGPCGKQWSKCQTSEQISSVFRKLKKTVGKVTRTRPSAPGENDTITFKVTVPRLVNDHKSKDDVLTVYDVMAESGSRTRYSLVFARNGTTVVRYSALITADGVASSEHQAVDIDRGGAETLAALSIDPKPYRAIKAGRVEAAPAVVCQGGSDECKGCYGWKVAVLVTSVGAGALIGHSRGAAGIGAALGVAVGASVASFIDCGPACGRRRCNTGYCDCVRNAGHHPGYSPSCSQSLEGCCNGTSGSFCTRNSSGCFACQ